MDRYLEAVFDEYGGADAFFRESDAHLAHFNETWLQDIELVGRILRAHLVVEHFLTEYLEACNPKLPSLRKAGLTFDQKVRLLSNDDAAINSAIPGIRRLNQIRNRIAHNLALELTTEDRSAFLGVQFFSALRREKQKRGMSVGEDPIDVLEDFSKLAASWLQSGANGSSEKLTRAISRAAKQDDDR